MSEVVLKSVCFHLQDAWRDLAKTFASERTLFSLNASHQVINLIKNGIPSDQWDENLIQRKVRKAVL